MFVSLELLSLRWFDRGMYENLLTGPQGREMSKIEPSRMGHFPYSSTNLPSSLLGNEKTFYEVNTFAYHISTQAWFDPLLLTPINAKHARFQ